MVKQAAVLRLLQIEGLNKKTWTASDGMKAIKRTGPTLEWGTAKEIEKLPPASFWKWNAFAGGGRWEEHGKGVSYAWWEHLSTKN